MKKLREDDFPVVMSFGSRGELHIIDCRRGHLTISVSFCPLHLCYVSVDPEALHTLVICPLDFVLYAYVVSDRYSNEYRG